MTSSYNISRRPLKDVLSPINWGAYQRQFGICYGGYVTVPITNPDGKCTDWKFCVPIEQEDEILKKSKNKETREINETRHFTRNLYNNPLWTAQSETNLYPPCNRPPYRAELDMKDYFRLPMGYDGTGYRPTRSWNYAETATDYINLPRGWSPFHLVQRKDVQEAAKKELIYRKQHNIPPYTTQYPGVFYE